MSRVSQKCPKCRLLNPPSAVWCDCGYVFDRDAAQAIGRADVPVNGALICPQCGLFNPPNALHCDCSYRFHHPPHSSSAQTSSEQTSSPSIQVACPSCACRLRLPPPLAGRKFKCPSCHCWFRATQSTSASVELEVITDHSQLSRHYEILRIRPGATLDEIRTAYRRRLLEYHPDKVATLGMEIQALAEEKTKQINEAYTLLLQALSKES